MFYYKIPKVELNLPFAVYVVTANTNDLNLFSLKLLFPCISYHKTVGCNNCIRIFIFIKFMRNNRFFNQFLNNIIQICTSIFGWYTIDENIYRMYKICKIITKNQIILVVTKKKSIRSYLAWYSHFQIENFYYESRHHDV